MWACGSLHWLSWACVGFCGPSGSGLVVETRAKKNIPGLETRVSSPSCWHAAISNLPLLMPVPPVLLVVVLLLIVVVAVTVVVVVVVVDGVVSDESNDSLLLLVVKVVESVTQ